MRTLSHFILILTLLVGFNAFSQESCKDVVGKKPSSAVARARRLLNHLNEIREELSSKLGIYTDPFITSSALDPARSLELVNQLSYEIGSNQELSALGHVRQFLFSLKGNEASLKEQNLRALFSRVLRTSHESLGKPRPTIREMQVNYLAIELLQPLLYKWSAEPTPPDTDKDKDKDKDKEESDDKNKDEDKSEDSDESESETEEQEPELIELPKDYDPHTKETESQEEQKQNKQSKFVHIQLSGQTAYWRQKVFNVISRFGSNRFSGGSVPMQSHDRRSQTRQVQMFMNFPSHKIGQDVSLSIPTGFIPLHLKADDYEINPTPSGAFTIRSTKKSIAVSLVKETMDLNPLQTEFFTTPIGMSHNEWPQSMQTELMPLLDKSKPLESARLIEGYIRNRYLYSVNAKDEHDPIEALNRGAFQCDMAALVMVGLLRDHLGIPARVAGGFRAKKGAQNTSLLILPAEGHAWVEVFHGGQIHSFDPTPKNKDKKTKENGESGEPDAQKDFDDETFPSEEQEQDGDSTDSNDDQDSNIADESDKTGNEEGDSDNESDDNYDQKTYGESKQSSKPGDDKDGELDELEKAIEQEKLEESLSIGSLSLKDESPNIKVLNRAIRLLIREHMNPKKSTQAGYSLLSKMKLLPMLRGQEFSNLLSDLENAVKYKQIAVPEALLEISALLKSTPVNKSYKQLLQLLDRLYFYRSLLDPNLKSTELNQAIRLLEEAQIEFLKLLPKNSLEIAVVDKFRNELPNLSRQIFEEKFKINDTHQTGYSESFRALSTGQLAELNLVRILHPLTNYIMDSEPAPAYSKARTQLIDSGSKAMPVYTQKTDLHDQSRALRGQPNKSFLQNLTDGTLFHKVRHFLIYTPDKGGEEDPYRVTMALYDTSGSMNGEPGDFQAALLAAFTDRALSEVGPSGEHRHVVQLMGFDEDVHTVHPVRNSFEAKDVIKNYRTKLANTGKGTNIQEALKQAFAQILDAQNRAGEPLASANIILMTDGQSDVDIEEVKKWRAAIDRRTPIKLLFIAINGTNPQLEELAESMREIGVENSFFQQFLPEDIAKLVKESRTLPKYDQKRDFHAKESPLELPPTVSRNLDSASQLLRSVIARHEKFIVGQSLDDIDRKLFALPQRDENQRTEFLTSIQNLRDFAKGSDLFLSQGINTIIINDLIKNLGPLVGKNFEDLTKLEVQSLRWLIVAFKNVKDH